MKDSTLKADFSSRFTDSNTSVDLLKEFGVRKMQDPFPDSHTVTDLMQEFLPNSRTVTQISANNNNSHDSELMNGYTPSQTDIDLYLASQNNEQDLLPRKQ